MISLLKSRELTLPDEPARLGRIRRKRRDILVVSGKDGRLRLVDRASHALLADIALVSQENTEAPVTVEDPVEFEWGGVPPRLQGGDLLGRPATGPCPRRLSQVET